MTSLQILVYCQSVGLITLAYFYYRNAMEIKKCQKLSSEEFEKRIDDVKTKYINTFVSAIDSIRDYSYKRVKESLGEFMAKEFEKYWMTQFSANKPDNKNG